MDFGAVSGSSGAALEEGPRDAFHLGVRGSRQRTADRDPSHSGRRQLVDGRPVHPAQHVDGSVALRDDPPDRVEVRERRGEHHVGARGPVRAEALDGLVEIARPVEEVLGARREDEVDLTCGRDRLRDALGRLVDGADRPSRGSKSSIEQPAAPASANIRTVCATPPGSSGKHSSESTLSGIASTDVSDRTWATSSSRVTDRSGRPSDMAKPELVVARAANPRSSSWTAEPTSQALGIRNRPV